MTVEQLALELEPQRANPNALMFNADGTPKRLLWCSDTARLGGTCPYSKGRNPCPPCCKELDAG